MKSFSYVLQDAEGIHARPAGELVKLAKTFSSKVVIAKGEDEEAAAAAIEECMKANL